MKLHRTLPPLLVAMMGGCSDVGTGPTAEVVARVVLSPDSVTLPAGSVQRFQVELRGATGDAIAAEVGWASTDTAVARLDSAGVVRVRRAGVASIVASAGAASDSAVVRVTPGAPAGAIPAGGDGQTGLAAEPLSSPLAVRVVDGLGNGVPGIAVAWAVEAGGGGIDPVSSTDTLGVASARWTMGRHAGAARASATPAVAGAPPIGFTATATPNATISGRVTARNQPAGWGLPLRSRASAGRTGTPDAAAPATPGPARLIVTFRSSAMDGAPGTADVAGVSREIRARLRRADAPPFRVTGVSPAILAARVSVDDPQRLDALAAALRGAPGVASVERDGWMHPVHDRAVEAVPGRRLPGDAGYASQAWHYGLIDLPRAWRVETGSAAVVVAVVDDGVRFDHPSLAANLTADGYDFVSHHQVSVCGRTLDNAGDGNGYDADPTTPAAYDCSTGGLSHAGGHGTHVAGTVGAAGGDPHPMVGVSWAVRIRPVRVLGPGGGSAYDVAQGILYAAGLPADDGAGGVVRAPTRAHVINISFGGPEDSEVRHAAVRAAARAGSLVVAAAGNGRSRQPRYPAAYPEALSVSAVSPWGRAASYSSIGPTVDIAAPGGEASGADATYAVASTLWNFAESRPTFGYLQGTSMAAPHVAGVAALLLAREPSLTAEQVRARLTEFAVDLGDPGPDEWFGAGLVNARNALTRTRAPRAELYARLYDAQTGALVSTVAAPGGAYRFAGVPDGEYLVFAGEDEDGDARVGVAGRRWGTLTTADRPQRVRVDGAGSYTASFDVGMPVESEPNDTPGDADLLVAGGSLRATFSDASDVDLFRVTLPAGRYTFATRGVLDGACGFAHSAATRLELRTETGTLVGASEGGSGPADHCARLEAALPGGTYLLRLGGRGWGYHLEVSTPR